MGLFDIDDDKLRGLYNKTCIEKMGVGIGRVEREL